MALRSFEDTTEECNCQRGALLYIHPSKSSEPDAPTSTTGIGGLYTNTNTWAVAAFHDGYYRDDSILSLFGAG
jgi:hypothetical protein